MDIETNFGGNRNLRIERTETSQSTPFSVQPNPAKDVVWISFHYYDDMENIGLTATDITGRIILGRDQINTKGIIELEVHDWPNGIYFIELKLDGNSLGVVKCEIQH